MKSIKTIRRTVAMMVIFFAVAATGCKKESEITPGNNATTPPTIPVTPAVVAKPRSIITIENGSAVRKQLYGYDGQGKLVKYESSGANSDSVVLSANSVIFKRLPSATPQVLDFNTDKTFKSITAGSFQSTFQNNRTKLGSFSEQRSNGTIATVAQFVYTGNNMTRINTEVRTDFNYYDNLPYQKGINVIPLAFKAIQYYKLMELDNLTTTTLYDKMLRQVIINRGTSRFEMHEFTYVFDASNRVTQITDTITNTTPTSSTQKVQVSTVAY